MTNKKKIVVLSGAGISAESGLSTFRGQGGLWEGHDIRDVASPEGWIKDRNLVLNFYNERRRHLLEVEPNDAHRFFAELQSGYQIDIINQNVDDLHERAGSNSVIHLHGELLKARSTSDPDLVYDWRKDINPGDKCEHGSQLRPHIVWFGEAVPKIESAAMVVMGADILMVIGTSLQVYPAAGLLSYASRNARVYYIDPNPGGAQEIASIFNMRIIAKQATLGVIELSNYLTEAD